MVASDRRAQKEESPFGLASPLLKWFSSEPLPDNLFDFFAVQGFVSQEMIDDRG